MVQYLWTKILKKIRGAGVIGSKIDKSSKIGAGSHVVNSVFDKYSFCGYDCEIINCEVGSFCSIASNVTVGGAFHPVIWGSTSSVFYRGRSSVRKKFAKYGREEDRKSFIGNDVWIGNHVLIKQGVKVGHGAVIGMGSVVTKDVPPYEIWAGNPARLIRKRFSDDIIEKFLAIEWWNLNEEDLQKAAVHIREPIEFIEICEKLKGGHGYIKKPCK